MRSGEFFFGDEFSHKWEKMRKKVEQIRGERNGREVKKGEWRGASGGCGRAEGERLTRHHCAASPLLSKSDSHLSRTNRSLISQMEPSKYPATRRDATPRGARIFFFCFLSARATCNLIAERSTEDFARLMFPSSLPHGAQRRLLLLGGQVENFDNHASPIRVSLLSRPETGCWFAGKRAI